MSVVGFDIGDKNCTVAVGRHRRIDVVRNDESSRKTPAIVYFGEEQEPIIGTAGASLSLRNPKNAVSQIKRLIGKQFSDPEVQRDLQSLPFTVVEGPDGGVQIHVRYLGDNRVFNATQILAMLLLHLKQIAETKLETAVVNCCIGIPIYFTDLQRRAFLEAASFARLRPLRLMHETTATALAYGFYKTDLPENDPLNVLFVDIGHASMQVCVAAFKKGQLKILSHTYDRSLGGRDFDEVLFRHFADKFKEQYQIDVPTNVQASQKLRAACEKLKKALSDKPEASCKIKCLMDEKDVSGFIKRDEFEQLAQQMLERVKVPCVQALTEAGITVDKIHAVEVVGSGSRVPAILKILTQTFGKEPTHTMNASEYVARGCALQCAILRPTFEVREFRVQESFPFSFVLSWKDSAPAAQQRTKVVFHRGKALRNTKVVILVGSGTFTADISYEEVNQGQAPALIRSYKIGPLQTSKGEKAEVKVKFRLDKHGIVSIDSATMIEEEEIEVPVSIVKEGSNDKKESAAMDTDDAQNNGTSAAGDNADVNMQDAKNAAVPATAGTATGAENGIPEAEDKAAQMESDAKAKTVKMVVKKTEVPLAMPRTDLQKATDEEFEMASQDRYMEETKEKKNAVEANACDMRNKDDMLMVRRSAATNLGKYPATVEPQYPKTDIISFFKDLKHDGKNLERILAVEGCAALGKRLEPQDCAAHILPVIIAFSQHKSWRVRYMVANQLDEFCEAVGPEPTRVHLVPAYVRLLHDNKAEVRFAAAGKVTKFCRILDPQFAIQHILPCVKELSTDSSQHVRSALAFVIMGMAPVLGKEATIDQLLPIFLALLKDEFPDVRVNIISKLEQVHQVIGNRHWRVRLAIIEHIPLLASQLGVESFDDKLGSLYMHWLGDQVSLIREAAANNLKRLAEEFGPEWAIQHIVPQVLEKINNPRYLHRITILNAISLLAPVMGREITCQTMLPVVINASKDSVPNVRFNVAKVLQSLIPIVDHSVAELSICPCLVELSEDPDVDVRDFAGQALQACDQVMKSS